MPNKNKIEFICGSASARRLLSPVFISALLLSPLLAKDCCKTKNSTAALSSKAIYNVAKTGKNSPGKDINQGLSMSLISQVTSIKPGQTFEVGIKIEHESKFHTYWKNSGIVGVPTKLTWKLPEGFKVSEMRWANPERSLMSGIPCYGYERDILLTFTVTPPSQISDKEIILGGDIKWMCCAKDCYPGFDKLHLKLPVGNGTVDKTTEDLFVKATKDVPTVNEAISAKLVSAVDDKTIKLEIKSSDPINPIHLFSQDGQTTPDLKFSLTSNGKNTWIYTAQRSEFSPKQKKTFPFVLQTKEGFFSVTAK